jgi:hypothetical protein
MSSRVEPLARGAGVFYGACGGLWVMVLFGPPSAADMLLARGTLKAMRERYEGGFPTLTWVLSEAGMSMDAEARKTAATVTREFEGVILAQAKLVEGSGFQVATVRAILSGLDMMVRSRAPRKVFAELRPAVEWAVGHRSAPGPTAAVLGTAIEEVRRTLTRSPRFPGGAAP